MTNEGGDRPGSATPGELAAAVTLRDFLGMGAHRVGESAWDYIDGGSWDEVSLAENEAAWRRYRFRPRVLVDVSRVDPSTTMLGSPVAMPVAIAPMAAHGLVHPDGEAATARAAGAAGIGFIPSTMSTNSMEKIADAGPDTTRWFQLYAQADPGRTRSFVERAEAAGYKAIILTVDLPELGYRDRDRRSGFELDVELGNFEGGAGPTHGSHGTNESYPEIVDEWVARSLTWDSIATIRSWSDLPLVLKGIMTGEDARLAVDHGVDAIVVSNHGGRQLDRTPAPIEVLSEIKDAAPQMELWVDGGVRRGLDVAIARAMGAQGVLVGRPILWALAAGGQAGVERALAILREEFEIAMALLGATTPDGLTRDHLV